MNTEKDLMPKKKKKIINFSSETNEMHGLRHCQENYNENKCIVTRILKRRYLSHVSLKIV